MASVLDASRRFRRDLLSADDAARAELLRRYATVEAAVERETAQLAVKIEAARAAGEDVRPSWLWRSGHLAQTSAAIRAEMARYARQAVPVIAAHVNAAAALGGTAGHGVIDVVAPSLVRPLNARAFAELVGQLAADAPLATLLGRLPDLAAERLEAALVEGIALGRAPAVIARQASEAASGLPRARALLIARTESLRAYREASRETWRANRDVVGGWTWLSSLDRRTCASCWSMHGTVHRLDEPMGTHPACRCTMVPALRGEYAALGPTITPGLDRFERAPEATQLAVLGPAKLASYRRGEIALGDLVHKSRSRRYGTGRREAGLTEARDNARVRRAAESEAA